MASDNIWNNEELENMLKRGEVLVMPTDTLYGIVGSALHAETVDKIYELRGRNKEKPCIILIGNADQLEKFEISLSVLQKEKIEEYWPGPTSIIFDCPSEDFKYLHRGTKSLAFRLPASEHLRELLEKVGPLIAPSANREGHDPALTIEEARKYFGDEVSLYLDAGTVEGKASRVIRLHPEGTVDLIRA
ncbi:MAG TPA: L-threonylcarbamoyladenylate synthase [Candidatus Paceibacterota bacterium]|nr:L-threonylcarbamoyladenylate synthase [Candidatus Paceibacterota bacterium]